MWIQDPEDESEEAGAQGRPADSEEGGRRGLRRAGVPGEGGPALPTSERHRDKMVLSGESWV